MLNVADAKEAKGRPRSRLSCLVLLILLGVGGYFATTRLIIPFFETGGGNADTRPLPGDASRFDPIASLAEIQKYAGEGTQLISINALYVASDGTLDLNASYNPRVEFTFVREVPRPDDAPPPGAGGSNIGPWYETITIEAYTPGQWRSVSRTSGGVRLSYTYVNKGMEREVEDPTTNIKEIIPQPACSFADLWQEVVDRYEPPPDAVAIIDYDASGYRFNINGVGIYLNFDINCEVIE